MKRIFCLIVLLLIPIQSYALDLGIPVACEYGSECFIENYFDHNAKETELADHTCGKLSEDGNISTDFKLRNHKQMKDGVNVVAGDSGFVTHIRDGMSDVSVDLIGEETVRNRECGNGVTIEHKRGYVTQYCHLKQGSIVVKQGEKVEKGQVVGQVGLSGLSTFPYLEFTVTLDSKPVDPFTGEDPVTGDTSVPCGSLDIYPLWDKKTEKRLYYISTALLNAGFSKKVPHAEGAREGKFGRTRIDDKAKIIVFWVDIFGIEKDDTLTMQLVGPDGEILKSEDRVYSSAKRHNFQFMGEKSDGKRWTAGKYTGRVILTRKTVESSEEVIKEEFHLDIYKDES